MIKQLQIEMKKQLPLPKAVQIEKAALPISQDRPLTDNLELLLEILPQPLSQRLEELGQREALLEIIMDLGRPPYARYLEREVELSLQEVSETDLSQTIARLGSFGSDNRAGIERTLHRISVIRNRAGKPVGLTIRIGRAVFGTIDLIEDLVESGESLLLLGKPGVGKTTMLRETARVLADDFHKRVVIVDTSNEIAGDGDIPHPAIGRARRMQVAKAELQHQVMIEAVENHMPQVVVIDEIGTQLETQAARTINERGVQLIGTAHGQTLENLMLNPTLSDLVGGIQSVTLGDEEARRRGSQKSVLERKAPPTFNMLVEIQSRDEVVIHRNVSETVDAILREEAYTIEVRKRNASGKVESYQATITPGEGNNTQSLKPNQDRAYHHPAWERDLLQTQGWERYYSAGWSEASTRTRGYEDSHTSRKKHGANRKTGPRARFLRSA